LYAQVVRLSVFKLVNTIFSKRMLFGTQLAHGKGHGTINFEGHEVKGITRCQRFLGEGIILDLFGRVSFIDYSTIYAYNSSHSNVNIFLCNSLIFKLLVFSKINQVIVDTNIAQYCVVIS